MPRRTAPWTLTLTTPGGMALWGLWAESEADALRLAAENFGRVWPVLPPAVQSQAVWCVVPEPTGEPQTGVGVGQGAAAE